MEILHTNSKSGFSSQTSPSNKLEQARNKISDEPEEAKRLYSELLLEKNQAREILVEATAQLVELHVVSDSWSSRSPRQFSVTAYLDAVKYDQMSLADKETHQKINVDLADHYSDLYTQLNNSFIEWVKSDISPWKALDLATYHRKIASHLGHAYSSERLAYFYAHNVKMPGMILNDVGAQEYQGLSAYGFMAVYYAEKAQEQSGKEVLFNVAAHYKNAKGLKGKLYERCTSRSAELGNLDAAYELAIHYYNGDEFFALALDSEINKYTQYIIDARSRNDLKFQLGEWFLARQLWPRAKEKEKARELLLSSQNLASEMLEPYKNLSALHSEMLNERTKEGAINS